VKLESLRNIGRPLRIPGILDHRSAVKKIASIFAGSSEIAIGPGVQLRPRQGRALMGLAAQARRAVSYLYLVRYGGCPGDVDA
jgi:hypothetical protein